MDSGVIDACRRGHEYTEENTVLRWYNGRLGRRECRTCRRIRARARPPRVSTSTSLRPLGDGIVDEVALERAQAGDEAVYEALTRQEHEVLVKRLADRGLRHAEDVPIGALRWAIASELNRRRKRDGLVG